MSASSKQRRDTKRRKQAANQRRRSEDARDLASYAARLDMVGLFGLLGSGALTSSERSWLFSVMRERASLGGGGRLLQFIDGSPDDVAETAGWLIDEGFLTMAPDGSWALTLPADWADRPGPDRSATLPT